jgi:hypothetical protein
MKNKKGFSNYIKTNKLQVTGYNFKTCYYLLTTFEVGFKPQQPSS